jgi:hypothetical protein
MTLPKYYAFASHRKDVIKYAHKYEAMSESSASLSRFLLRRRKNVRNP